MNSDTISEFVAQQIGKLQATAPHVVEHITVCDDNNDPHILIDFYDGLIDAIYISDDFIEDCRCSDEDEWDIAIAVALNELIVAGNIGQQVSILTGE